MADRSLSRASPLTALAARGAPCPAAELHPTPPRSRFVFRGSDTATPAAGAAFGVPLPQKICRAATGGDRAALCLGPDEWLLIAPPDCETHISRAIADTLSNIPHALVSIGHRAVGLEIAGTEAATVLAAGCPLDLDALAFPVGMCTRTVLGKTEIVLWRTAPEIFLIDVSRSFAGYAWQFLDEARREFR